MSGPDPNSEPDFMPRLRQQELVAEFGLFAMEARGLQTALDEAAAVAARGLETQYAKVLEHLPHDRAFIVRSGVGWREGVVGHARLGDGLESPAGYAFRTSKPVMANHLGGETRFRVPELLIEHGIHSAINVIIHAGDASPFGVLEVDSTRREQFVEFDTRFLQALANTLAAALQAQKRQDSLEALLKEKEHILHEKDQLLQEKDLLMREVDHRITNSLQMVQTVLILQARNSSNDAARQMLDEAASRIMAIGAIHKWLYRGATGGSIDGRHFLASLIDEIRHAFAEGPTDRPIQLEMDAMALHSETAVPVGLIVNELVTNALKYGNGTILVAVRRQGPALEIVVDDAGDGFPLDFDTASRTGLGMRLVSALTKNRGGTVKVDREVAFGRIRVRLDDD